MRYISSLDSIGDVICYYGIIKEERMWSLGRMSEKVWVYTGVNWKYSWFYENLIYHTKQKECGVNGDVCSRILELNKQSKNKKVL